MSYGEVGVDAHQGGVVRLRPLMALAKHSDPHPPGFHPQRLDQSLPKESEHTKGLRELRLQLLEMNSDTLTPHELLNILLSAVISEDQAYETSRDLLQRFTNIGNIITAKHEALCEFCDDVSILVLRSVYSLMKVVLRQPAEDYVRLRDLHELYEYLRLSLAHEQQEVVRLLFLNSKNALLKDELHSRGSINHTPVYPREIVRRVIELNANALIIVHNHPSGDPQPSSEDVGMTKLLSRVLNDIGVKLHDHIIVGGSRCESLRSLGLM